jgi:hypothetical protein
VVFVAMVIVGVSAAQIVWALFPGEESAPWIPIIGLGTFGSILGGLLFANALLHQSSMTALVAHPVGLVGSAVGTVAFVGAAQLMRRGLKRGSPFSPSPGLADLSLGL